MRLVILGTILATLAPPALRAQAGVSEVAAFTLLPFGARAVAMARAVSATGNPEAIWWNPAGVATSPPGVLAHHSQVFQGTADALGGNVQTRFGSVFASANLLDLGDSEVTDDGGSEGSTTGKILFRDVSLGAGYAATLGRFSGGVEYQYIQLRYDCSGECPGIPNRRSTSALALGAQFVLDSALGWRVGATLRNIELEPNTSPTEDVDNLPTQLQVGMQRGFDVPVNVSRDASLLVATDIVTAIPEGRISPRVGLELSLDRAFFLRAGYIFRAETSDAQGASVGIGLIVRGIAIDFARSFSGLSADAGRAPTFLSIHFGR